MKPRDLFSVAVRVVGLWVMLHLGLWNLLAMFCYRGLGVQTPYQGDDTMSFVVGIVFTPLGAYLLRGAPLLMDFAFPPDLPEGAEKKTGPPPLG